MSNNLNISTKDFSELPKMGLDDTGTLTIKFKITGANRYKDLDTGEAEEVSYSMDYEVVKINVDDVSLSEATRRALKQEPVLVKNSINPFPG